MSEDYFNNDGAGRDGYVPQNEGKNGGHTPRPRFNRNTRPAGSSNFNSQRGTNGEAFRPRYNQGRDQNYNGGYGQQRNYQPQQSGYGQPRQDRWSKPQYGQSDGYQPRQSQGGYRPRYNNDGYYNQQQDGYQPRGNNGGFGQQRPAGTYGQPRSNQYQGKFKKRQQYRGAYDPQAKYSNKKRIEYKEENYDPTQPLRLNKFLANAGVCSRRDADKFIEAGVVSVNGQVVTELGTKVLRTDEVRFHDNIVKIEKKIYVLLNKPKGFVTTSDDPQNRKTVMDLVSRACPERIYPVGRLDRNTTGVLLLTNDGDLASKLTHPKFLKKKIYHVTTDQNVSAADIRQIAEGITLDDGEIKADAVEYASPTDKKQIGIEIHSGKNRIVRRIFESLGYHVTKLDRVYFAGLTKKNVRRGDWRYLTEKEVNMLRMGAFE